MIAGGSQAAVTGAAAGSASRQASPPLSLSQGPRQPHPSSMISPTLAQPLKCAEEIVPGAVSDCGRMSRATHPCRVELLVSGLNRFLKPKSSSWYRGKSAPANLQTPRINSFEIEPQSVIGSAFQPLGKAPGAALLDNFQSNSASSQNKSDFRLIFNLIFTR